MTKGKRTVIITDILILIIVAAVIGVSMIFSRDIELALGLCYYVEVEEEEAAIQKQANAARDAELPQLNVHYVDVGQGDMTVIELPDGKTMVIDAGESNKKTEAAIDAFIETTFGAEFKYFDYAILTHPDSDHCGSMDYLLNNYPARVCYRPNVEAVGSASKPYTDPGKADLSPGAVKKETPTYADSIKPMYKANADFTPTVHITDPADESQTIVGGSGDDGYTFTFYSPLSVSYKDWNNYSPIMILTYRGYNIAFSGDAEKENEAEFVAKVKAARTDGITDKYDIFTDDYTVHSIKCGHHGSRTSTSQGYIDAITTPEGAAQCYYIISCGEGNSYKHPHQETLSRLESMNVPSSHILRTDLIGDITVSVEPDGKGGYTLATKSEVEPGPATLQRLDVVPPTVTEYKVGETVDFAGLKVYAVYSDGTRVQIDVGEYEVGEVPTDKAGEYIATVEYKGKTATFRIIIAKDQRLVYRKIGNIELKWQLVGWVLFALVALGIVLHMAIAKGPGDGKKSRGRKRS